MAGEINFGLVQPGLAGETYNRLQGQQQQTEMNQIKLEQLKQDRMAMLQLQSQLKAAGKNPDPNLVLDALIASGNPEYMMKGLEGKQKLQELTRAEGVLRQYAPELFPSAAPQQPANALLAQSAVSGTPAQPANALVAPQQAAPAGPTNALAGAPDIDGLRRQLFALSAVNDPRAKAMAEVLKSQITEATKPQVVGAGATLMQGGKPVYTAPQAATSDVRDYEYAKAQGYKGSFTDFMLLKPSASAAKISVSTEKKYGEAFGGKIADVDIGKMTTAEKAPQLAESANRIIDLAKQGNVFTGPAADIKLNIARAMNVAGASNQEKIANTEALIAATGKATLDAIHGAGLGTGQGFTDKDLKFLQGVAGGTINLTQQTLTDLATLQHKAAARSAEAWNKRVKEMPREVVQGTGLSMTPIQVPPLAAAGKRQSTQNPSAPAVGSVQNGYRFKGGNPAEAANWEKL